MESLLGALNLKHNHLNVTANFSCTELTTPSRQSQFCHAVLLCTPRLQDFSPSSGMVIVPVQHGVGYCGNASNKTSTTSGQKLTGNS